MGTDVGQVPRTFLPGKSLEETTSVSETQIKKKLPTVDDKVTGLYWLVTQGPLVTVNIKSLTKRQFDF
jgi:hypothetical protein